MSALGHKRTWHSGSRIYSWPQGAELKPVLMTACRIAPLSLARYATVFGGFQPRMKIYSVELLNHLLLQRGNVPVFVLEIPADPHNSLIRRLGKFALSI